MSKSYPENLQHQLPAELLNDIESIKGFDKESFQSIHASNQNLTSIRFNHKKINRYNSFNSIQSLYNIDEPVAWCDDAFYLKERPQFTFDPLLHAGAYYVQEASSMFLQQALKQTFDNNATIKVLDLCAAPGGKTTLLASYFKNAFIVSNEIIKTRANILYENVTKWGDENIVVTNNDAADFKRLPDYFDLIVVDAPCSGSGLFRKDENAIDKWSKNNVALCSQRQQRILADVYSSLKQDGILIYSTCSYSQQEDEDILDWLMNDFKLESIQLNVSNNFNIVETTSAKHNAFGYRFWPHKLKGEGFFIAALKKNDGDHSNYNNAKLNINKSVKKDTAVATQYINEGDWFFFNNKENVHVVNNDFIEDVALLQKNVYVKKAGIKLGEVIREQLIPHHELALSNIIKKDLQKIDLSLEQALQYLRKKDINNNKNLKGWTLSTYKNFPLGWIKLLHNRVNNYYPTDWRILKD